MHLVGLEPTENPAISSEKQKIRLAEGSKSGSNLSDSTDLDHGLQDMAKVWANLPEQTRSEILALIQAAKPKQDR